MGQTSGHIVTLKGRVRNRFSDYLIGDIYETILEGDGVAGMVDDRGGTDVPLPSVRAQAKQAGITTTRVEPPSTEELAELQRLLIRCLTAHQRRWGTQLVAALAELVHDRDEAIALVKRCGFPVSNLPSASTSLVFWAQVIERAINGMSRGGALPLLEAAMRMYPENRMLSLCREGLTSVSQWPASLPEAVGAKDHAMLSRLSRHAIEEGEQHLLVPLALLEDAVAEDRWPGGMPRISVSLECDASTVRVTFGVRRGSDYQSRLELLEGPSGSVSLAADATLELARVEGSLRLTVRAGRTSPLQGKSVSILSGLSWIRSRFFDRSSGALGTPSPTEELVLLEEIIEIRSLEPGS